VFAVVVSSTDGKILLQTWIKLAKYHCQHGKKITAKTTWGEDNLLQSIHIYCLLTQVMAIIITKQLA